MAVSEEGVGSLWGSTARGEERHGLRASIGKTRRFSLDTSYIAGRTSESWLPRCRPWGRVTQGRKGPRKGGVKRVDDDAMNKMYVVMT